MPSGSNLAAARPTSCGKDRQDLHMGYTKVTDFHFDVIEGLSSEHEAVAIEAANTIKTFDPAEWQSKHFDVAIDDRGQAGFLVSACLPEKVRPSAHQLLELTDGVHRILNRDDAVLTYIDAGVATEFIYGPGILVFVPGIEDIDIKVEQLFDLFWP
jgi:hypothetical protein